MKLNIEKNLFKQIRTEKENFTSYEKFMYEDNQKRSPNSPGLQTNLAGGNYKNKYDNNYTTLSGSNSDGFDKLYNKTSVGTDRIHLFTDVYNVEQPPFFNTNDFVYLSFILRSTGSVIYFTSVVVCQILKQITLDTRIMIMVEIIKYLLMLLVVQYYQILCQLVHIIKDIFLNHNKIILDQKKEKDVFNIK